MADEKKKAGDRGVVDSIYALRMARYNTKGPGAERARPKKIYLPGSGNFGERMQAHIKTLKPVTVDQLRAKVAKVAAKKKSKKKGRRR